MIGDLYPQAETEIDSSSQGGVERAVEVGVPVSPFASAEGVAISLTSCGGTSGPSADLVLGRTLGPPFGMAADRGPASGRGALAVLCLCAFTHSYLLFSVFPYGAYYALHLLDDDAAGEEGSWSGRVTVDTVGVYAGE